MKFEIKNFWTGKVLIEIDADSIKFALEIATGNRIDSTGAYLKGAYLTGADLKGAYLKGAYLSAIKYDFWAVLTCAVKEIPFLREALIEGKVNGSQYSGECACLVGTIANAKKCSYDSIKILKPDSARPAERFFLAINRGDTPKNNEFSRLAVEWLDEYVKNISEFEK